MAVQKSRVSRSRRGMRRAHHALSARTISTDIETGERHLRYHISPDGYYRGREVLTSKATDANEEE